MAPRAATVEHSHLFPGARLRLTGAPVEPGGLAVRFSDGVEVDAELIALAEPPGHLLSVPEFVTAAGATISAKVWSVREIVDDGDDQVLVIGPRTDLEVPPRDA